MTHSIGSTVLVVGDRKWKHALARHLGRRGYDCTLTSTLDEAQRALRMQSFSLVLSRISLEDGSASALIGSLVGTRASLYLCMTTPKGWLWLPTVKEGRDCWGLSALGPGKSSEIVDGILEETIACLDHRRSPNHRRLGWFWPELRRLATCGLVRSCIQILRRGNSLIWSNRSITTDAPQIGHSFVESVSIRSIKEKEPPLQAQRKSAGPVRSEAVGGMRAG
jgi:hypothetical protein